MNTVYSEYKDCICEKYCMSMKYLYNIHYLIAIVIRM